MRKLLLLVAAMSLLMVYVGCSSSSQLPTQPNTPNLPQGDNSSNGTELLYSGTFEIDLDTRTITRTDDRQSDYIYDITWFLPDKCPGGCFRYAIVGVVGTVLEIELTMENPLAIQAFDVRVEYLNLYGKTVLNPDSYTDFLGTPITDVFPFTAFAKEHPDRAFPMGPGGIDTETMFLDFPPGANPSVDYAITAHLPGPTLEPYEMTEMTQAGELTPSGGLATISCRVYDHQDNVSGVYMNATPFTGGPVQLLPVVGNPGYYDVEISNTAGAPVGEYVQLIMALSANPQNVSTYNYVEISVVDDQPSGAWTCFLHDAQHTGVADCVLDPASLELKWTFPTGGDIKSSPVISDGITYFGSNDAKVYAVEVSTGIEVWNSPVDSAVCGTAAIGIDAIYIGTEGGFFYALSRANGSEFWHYQFTDTGSSGSAGLYVNGAILHDNRVYFAANNGKVYGLDATDGSELFAAPTYEPGNGNSLHTVPAYNEADDTLIVTADSYDVMCFDAFDGTEIWRYDTADFIDCSPTLADGFAYFTNKDSAWKFDITTNPPVLVWNEELMNPDPFVVIASGALCDDYYFSLGFLAGKISAHGISDGVVDWTQPLDAIQGFSSSPAISGDTIFCASTVGVIYGFDTSTGTEVFSYDVGDYIGETSIAIADNRLLVGCNDDNMYCFGEI
jgi:outer membrane protein assembly factor BamB